MANFPILEFINQTKKHEVEIVDILLSYKKQAKGIESEELKEELFEKIEQISRLLPEDLKKSLKNI